jgi:hypothetical protein
MATHAESPIAKYILHVQIVAHGNNAPHINPTTTIRIANKTATKLCCASRLASRNSGNLEGISTAYTKNKVLVPRHVKQMLLTLLEGIRMFADVTRFLLAMCQPCCQTVKIISR